MRLAMGTFPDLSNVSQSKSQRPRRPMRQRPRRLRDLEAGVRRRGAAPRASAASAISALMGDELRAGDHQCRSQPAQFQALARSVHASSAARPRSWRAGRGDEAEERGAVRLDRAALRRAGRAADRDLGHGERLWQPARQPEHAVLDRDAGLRLPAAGIFHRPALCRAETDRCAARCRPASAARCMARSARRSSCRRPCWNMASAISRRSSGALTLDREFPESPWLAAPAPAISRAKPNFAAIEAWNAAQVYQKAIAIMGRQIDGGGVGPRRPRERGDPSPSGVVVRQAICHHLL